MGLLGQGSCDLARGHHKGDGLWAKKGIGVARGMAGVKPGPGVMEEPEAEGRFGESPCERQAELADRFSSGATRPPAAGERGEEGHCAGGGCDGGERMVSDEPCGMPQRVEAASQVFALGGEVSARGIEAQREAFFSFPDCF